MSVTFFAYSLPPLLSQLKRPVSDEKVYVCNIFAFSRPPPLSQLGSPVNDEKVYVCNVFAQLR